MSLSGGVDSSSLAAITGGVLGIDFRTLSFVADPEDLYRHDLSFIEPLAERFGFPTKIIRQTAVRRFEAHEWAPKVAFQIPHPVLCELPRFADEAPVRVLFGGESADEVCGSVATLPDWALQVPLNQLIRGRMERRLPTGDRDLLRWCKHRLLKLINRPFLPFPDELPEFVRAEVKDEYREWLDRRRREAMNDERPWRSLARQIDADGFVAMNWEACSALDIRRCFPFFNRRVLELAFECHPSDMVGPGIKKLLRNALNRDVPRENLERRDGGNFLYLFKITFKWNQSLPQSLSGVLGDAWFRTPLRQVGYSDACRLKRLVLLCETSRKLMFDRLSSPDMPAAKAV